LLYAPSLSVELALAVPRDPYWPREEMEVHEEEHHPAHYVVVDSSNDHSLADIVKLYQNELLEIECD
jgi:hypothetical protein